MILKFPSLLGETFYASLLLFVLPWIFGCNVTTTAVLSLSLLYFSSYVFKIRLGSSTAHKIKSQQK
jgi:hypothetical protein